MVLRRALATLTITAAVVAGGVPATAPPAGAVRQPEPPDSAFDCEAYGPSDTPANVEGRYVALVYIHQVERCPGGSEMAYWVGRRQAGMTRLQLAEAVDRSPEALDGILLALFDRVGIERLPTTAERDGARAELRASRDLTRVTATFLGSDEAIDEYGLKSARADDADDVDPALRDEDWVRDMYLQLLGRTPDDAGVAYYTSTFGPEGSTAAQRTRVVTSMLRSAEFRRFWVQLAYTSILGRSAGPDEVAFWDGWLRGTGRNRTLLLRSLLIASDEAWRIVDVR